MEKILYNSNIEEMASAIAHDVSERMRLEDIHENEITIFNPSNSYKISFDEIKQSNYLQGECTK